MRRVFVVAAFVSVLVVAPMTVSLAQEGFTFERDPASGPPGTEIDVTSVTPCPPPPEAADPFVSVILVAPDDEVVDGDGMDLDGSGVWEALLIVPEDAVPGAYIIAAACFADDDALDAGEPYAEYQEQTFEVTPVATTTTPPTTTTTAPPVRAQPTFTG
jgi:hypothetical protein